MRKICIIFLPSVFISTANCIILEIGHYLPLTFAASSISVLVPTELDKKNYKQVRNHFGPERMSRLRLNFVSTSFQIRALHGVGNPYGCRYWIWSGFRVGMDIIFRETFWGGVGNGVKISKCLQNTFCPYSFLPVWNNDLFINRAYLQALQSWRISVETQKWIWVEMGIFLQKNPDMDGHGSSRTGWSGVGLKILPREGL